MNKLPRLLRSGPPACLALAFLLCATPPDTAASYITLRATPSATLRQGQVTVNVEITNEGDETAAEVFSEASLDTATASSGQPQPLAPNTTTHFTIHLGTPPSQPGLHTVVVVTRYQDGNGFPFTALSAVPLLTGDVNPDDPSLSITAPPCRFMRSGQLNVRIRPNRQAPGMASLRLVLPAELECDNPSRKLQLQPGTEQTVSFPIRNQRGLAGSSYPALVIVNDSQGATHRSWYAVGQINLTDQVLSAPFRRFLVALAIACAILFLLLQLTRLPTVAAAPALAPFITRITAPMPPRLALVLDLLAPACVALFVAAHLPWNLLLADTLTVGGDTPAHNYMASRLASALFGEGRLVSWAGGWWCGFPLFQYYFTFPYLLIALLDLVMPFNIAFKLVSISGILSLPFAAWLSARLMRLRNPGPSLLALCTLVLLMDKSHAMWGVNAYSTLAGMISNSISFSIMLLALGAAVRDAHDQRFRTGTALLLACLIASHFFTSIIAACIIALIPFLGPRRQWPRSFAILAAEGTLAVLLMAWWIIPLLAKRDYSMDFGTNWNVNVWKCFPRFALGLAPFALLGLVSVFALRSRFAAIHAVMFVAGLFLFLFGYELSEVFVNVRLWPFILYGELALAAAGLAWTLSPTRAPHLAVTALLALTLLYGPGLPNHLWHWARWNYAGLQNKPLWPIFRDLVLPLDNTPGRLANDLHENNNAFGSSRIFEAVPHLIRKPVLEGGIVNSAAGALFSYYIQGETSDNCAGFPTLVTPTNFDFRAATAHLELFNVKQFIARSERTRAALANRPEWKLLDSRGNWQLYELTTHAGNPVFIPANPPIPVRITDWKTAGLQWIYTRQALTTPFVLLDPDQPWPNTAALPLDPAAFLQRITALRTEPDPQYPVRFAHPDSAGITELEVSDRRIRFTTRHPGRPHIIKCTHFPNWRLRGGGQVYRVTPCFLLVYPEQEKVELYYGYTFPDTLGRVLSAAAACLVLALALRTLYRRGRHVTDVNTAPASA